MYTRSMVRGMKDIPFEVLCDILKRCSGGNIYELAVLRAVNRTFKASVAMVRASSSIATGVATAPSLTSCDLFFADRFVACDR